MFLRLNIIDLVMIGSLVSGVGNLFGGFLSQQINDIHQQRYMNMQHQLNKDEMSLQNSYNVLNSLNAGVYSRRGKENAGLNVNSDVGFSPVSGSTPVGTQSPQAPQLSPIDFSQIMLAEAQANKANEDAEAQHIENERNKEADAVYNLVEYDSTGNLVLSSSLMNSPISNKGGFDALKDIKHTVAEVAEWSADEVQAEMQKLITDYQIDNKYFLYVAKLPKAEFNEIWSNVAVQRALKELYISQKELNISEKAMVDLEKDIKENSNIASILGQIADDFDNGNYLSALGGVLKALLFGALQVGGVNASFNVGRSKK